MASTYVAEGSVIKDNIYPMVETSFKNSTIVNAWRRYMAKYIQSRHEKLYAIAPYENIYFLANDVTEYYKATNINKSLVNKELKNTYYYPVSNFNPAYAKDDITIVILCMLRYFYINRKKDDDKDLELAMINMSFSGKMYPSIFYKHFHYPPQAHVMEYVVNNLLSQKYELVTSGSVIGAIKSITSTWLFAYDDRFKNFEDEDCVYLIQQLHNRISSFMNNIASVYYDKAIKNKNYITYDSDDVSEDKFRLADNDSFKIERIVQSTMKYITNKGVNYRNCKIASNDNVKYDELKSILENIFNNEENAQLVKEYITLTVTLYFRDSEFKDVKRTDFIISAVKPTPNAKDKYIMRKKDILNQMLINNSEHFNRRRSRLATESAYYRAINVYFALTIQESN